MIAIIGEVLAQATPAATKGAVLTPAPQLPEAGFSLPLIVLTTVALILIGFGVVKFFQAFRKF